MQRLNDTDGDVAVLDSAAKGDSTPRRVVRREVDDAPAGKDDKKDAATDNEQIHPRFTRQQVEHVEQFAVCREFAAGEVLFEPGQREVPFFVVKGGSVDFFDSKPEGDRVFMTMPAPTFIGDVSIFTGQAALIGCRAAEACRVLEVSPEDLRKIVAQYSDIGDKILGAFMARRQWLSDNHIGETLLIGPRNDRDTFLLRNFLSRNGLPFEWADPETDGDTRLLLDRLNVCAEHLPVLVCGNEVCRRPTVAQVAEYAGLLPDLGTEPLRRGGRRRGAGGPGGDGLRRERGLADARPRRRQPRRPSRHKFQDRELPRLRHRHQRRGAVEAGGAPGPQVRRHALQPDARRRPRLRRRARGR